MNDTETDNKKDDKIKKPLNEGSDIPKSRGQLKPSDAPDILKNTRNPKGKKGK